MGIQCHLQSTYRISVPRTSPQGLAVYSATYLGTSSPSLRNFIHVRCCLYLLFRLASRLSSTYSPSQMWNYELTIKTPDNDVMQHVQAVVVDCLECIVVCTAWSRASVSRLHLIFWRAIARGPHRERALPCQHSLG